MEDRSSEKAVNVAADELDSRQSSLDAEFGEMETRYQALVSDSCDLLAKLDSAVQCCGEYVELAGEVGRTLVDVESAVEQCTVADSEFDVQRQLDVVTTTAQRVAALGKIVSEFERAATTTKDALVDLGLADSDRVHTIQQDVETTKMRYAAVQQCSGDQQRLVNAAFAQLHDPSHNLAVLLNWVGRQFTILLSYQPLFMAALCNRGTIIFLSCGFFFPSFFLA